jgi:hypothetical protein
LKKKSFKEERVAKVGADDLDNSTTLESNKSLSGNHLTGKSILGDWRSDKWSPNLPCRMCTAGLPGLMPTDSTGLPQHVGGLLPLTSLMA